MFIRLELCNTWETLWTITQRHTHTKIHTVKKQSKLRFKKQPTNYTTSDMKIKQQTLTIYKNKQKITYIVDRTNEVNKRLLK